MSLVDNRSVEVIPAARDGAADVLGAALACDIVRALEPYLLATIKTLRLVSPYKGQVPLLLDCWPPNNEYHHVSVDAGGGRRTA